jgi:two-component sensor histidine kinase
MFKLESLRQHVLLPIWVLIIVAALWLCVFSATQLWSRMENDVHRETSNVAHLLVSQLDSVVQHVDELLRNIIIDQNRTIDNEDPNRNFKLNQILKQRWPKGPSPFGLLTISDKNGIVLATNRDHPSPSLNISKSDSFRYHSMQAMGDESLYISTPIADYISGQPVVLLSRALRNISGDFDGIVEASFKVNNFIDNISNLNIKDLGIVGISGLDGIARVSSNAGVISFGDDIRKNPVFGKVLGGVKEGEFDVISTRDGRRRIGYFTVSKMSPMYVFVGYDYGYIASAYYQVIGVLGGLWLIFSAVTFGALRMLLKIGRLNQQKHIQLLEATASERQRILTQMHDSIGASLASHVSQLDHGTDWVAAKNKANQILTELRLLVDSIFLNDESLMAALASVRYRMQHGFGPKGPRLIWEVDELPETPLLASQCALHLRLSLMEALSNVLQHARAQTVVLSAAYDKIAGLVTINVVDDGCGFETGVAISGHGLQNMQMRIAKLSLPSKFDIESRSGKGTTVRISIKWPMDA